MSEQPPTVEPPTLIHYREPGRPLGPAVCGADEGWRTSAAGEVTCFACRASSKFKAAQRGVGTPTPCEEWTPTPCAPVKLSGVIAASEELTELAREARRRELEAQAAKEMVAAARNERGMYVIEESIHHGDYRSTRRVEVFAITPLTVDCIIQSSAYGYGSWLHPERPEFAKIRREQLHQLVEDLKWGRTNRNIGWSTFRTITTH